MTDFIAVDGSTIFDVCLNTYGTLDLLGKLMSDNNFPGAATYPVAGQVFSFDETLVVNQQTFKRTALSGEKYATKRVIIPGGDIPGEFTLSTSADGTQSVVWVFAAAGDFELTIDWGDGHVEDYAGTGAITATHSYIDDATYVATISSEAIQKLLSIVLSDGDCRIVGASGLDACINLIQLDIASNVLTEFAAIGALPSLIADLSLYGNVLTEFNGSDLPSELITLNLANNALTEFNPPTGKLNAKLEQLILSGNQIGNFNPDYDLPVSLKNIYLDNNLLTIYDTQTTLLPPGLTGIYMNSNQITAAHQGISSAFPTTIANFTIADNVLSVVNINKALEDLDAVGYSAGVFNLINQTPSAPPTGLGLTAKNNMIARGCSVATD